VIPSLIFFGLIFGRWWRSALIAGTFIWVVFLLLKDIVEVDSRVIGMVLGAAGYAFLNIGVGVAAHQGVLRVVRRVRSGKSDCYDA
jgi:hypothetical protein